MGASDQRGMWKVKGVPQELLLVGYDVSDEAAEELILYLRLLGFPVDRIYPRYNTWKQRYLTPPDDELPWTSEELELLIMHLEPRNDIQMLDFSPGEGSEG